MSYNVKFFREIAVWNLTYGWYKYGKTNANAQNHTIDEINLFITDSTSLGDQHENLASEDVHDQGENREQLQKQEKSDNGH